MSAYLNSMFPGPETYGWIITDDRTEDHDNSVGTTGPSQCPPAILEELQRRADGQAARPGFESAVFHLYSNRNAGEDDEFVARGRLVWLDSETPDEDIVGSPLDDFGKGALGCTAISYPKRPRWTIS